MRYIIYLLLFFSLIMNGEGQSLPIKKDTLINTPYNFSVTISSDWKFLTKPEIEEQKRTSNNPNLHISALAYLGNKAYFDDIPHVYVIFYPQPKIGENGFAYSSKLILSNYIRDIVEKRMNKKFQDWSYKINENEYNIDTVKRMIMFNSFFKYSDGHTVVSTNGYFLMKTGIAEVNFSYDESIIVKFSEVMRKILSTVQIDSNYILVKD